jgi:hypothetical protein
VVRSEPYQVGVYEALHAAGIEPGWVIGTSIGAIKWRHYRRQIRFNAEWIVFENYGRSLSRSG